MRSVRLSALGRALADPIRAEILCVLRNGQPATAGQLAAHVGRAPSTTSSHLSALLDAGLVSVEPDGRHRYFRLRSPEVGELLAMVEAMDLPETSPASAPRSTDIATARTCYDHLAGDIGVAIFGSMVEGGLLETNPGEVPRLTAVGHARLRSFGIDTEALGRQRRPIVRACLDWERQTHHLGGGAARALLVMMFDQRWLRRAPDQRVVTVTDHGSRMLAEHFGVGR